MHSGFKLKERVRKEFPAETIGGGEKALGENVQFITLRAKNAGNKGQFGFR